VFNRETAILIIPGFKKRFEPTHILNIIQLNLSYLLTKNFKLSKIKKL